MPPYMSVKTLIIPCAHYMYLKIELDPLYDSDKLSTPSKGNTNFKMVSIKGKVYNVMLLALWIPRFTGTLIIRTAAESPVKITDILTETNSRYYTDLLTTLLVPTRISISTFQHFGRIISDYNIFLPLPLFVSVTLVEFK